MDDRENIAILERTTSLLRDYEIASGAVIGASILGLAAFIVYEQRSKKRSRKARTTINPFNLSLLCMGLSLTGLQIATACYYEIINHPPRQIRTFLPVYALQETFTYISQYCYMLYSWNRGAAVVRNVFPQTAIYFERLIFVAPFIISISIGVDVYQSYLINTQQAIGEVFDIVWYIVAFLPGIMIILYDVTILVTFLKFAMSTKYQGGLDVRFVIVSQYGIAATLCTMATFTVYALLSTVIQERILSRVLFAVITTLLNMCYLTLFAMKVALYFEGERKKKSTQDMLDRVLGPESSPKRSDTSALKTSSGRCQETVHHVPSTFSKP
ncbi:hypothetical protein HDU80_008378 [Chytriomyces hyalinus]|nr:hypothetical protein HDU80_008378 [Chytriomyces hyalinus]